MVQARERRKGGLLDLISGSGRGRGVVDAKEDDVVKKENSDDEAKEKKKARARALERKTLVSRKTAGVSHSF